MAMNRIPTLSDVAKLAGVSKSTVSRVLNGSTKISEVTSRRVLRVVRKLHYEPNIIARSLSRKKTNTIGVILEDILNPFFSEVAKGIETVLKQLDYWMLLTSSDFDYESEVKLTRMLIRYRVDGVLITPVKGDSEAISMLKERSIPFFVMNCSIPDKDVSWIETDNLRGAYMATAYLLDLGHRRFMCIRDMSLEGGRKRYEGFIKAIEERGLKISEQIVLGNAHSLIEGYELLEKFISENGTDCLPSAIVAVNDAVAIGCMESLLKHGVRVPQDVSIIGYDDINIAALTRVPLTTIHQPKFRMGEIAATQLMKMIQGKDQGDVSQLRVEPELIVRDSCSRFSK
jgi:LacI family transcriptional regulator